MTLATAGLLAAAPAGASAGDSPQPGDRFFSLERADLPRCPVREVEVRSPAWLQLGCRGLNRARVRVVRAPAHGRLGRVSQRLERVRYTPDEDFRGTDHIVVARRRGGRTWRTAVLVHRSGQSERPSCRSRHAITRFRSPVKVTVVCRGSALEPLRVARGPFSGRFANVRRSGGGARRTLTVRVRPGPSFVGQDLALVRARGRGGTEIEAVTVSTLPWRFRALGDSVTAGFGYYANGGQMSAFDLPFCKPGAVVTNRCSSNSDKGPSYTGPPEWSADYGLANDISWAAQFANDLPGGVTAPDMFQNLAVTGSAPSDWLPGGILNPQLQAIVAENPELIAFTMGANPLLTDVLLTVGGESCAFTSSVAALEACIQPFFTQVQLVTQLQRFYTALLDAPSSTIVTFQYHLIVPSANLFANWQLEALADYFNAQLATAVANTKAALPEQAQAAHPHPGPDDARHATAHPASAVQPRAAAQRPVVDAALQLRRRGLRRRPEPPVRPDPERVRGQAPADVLRGTGVDPRCRLGHPPEPARLHPVRGHLAERHRLRRRAHFSAAGQMIR